MKIEVKTGSSSVWNTVAYGHRTIALTDLAAYLNDFSIDDKQYSAKVIFWADRGKTNTLEIPLWDGSVDIWRIIR